MTRRSKIVPAPTSRFLRVKCNDCGSEQVTFDRATVRVNCQVCGATLLEPTGGLAQVKGEKVAELE